MQPLDMAVYGPLKSNWQDVCHHYLQSHPGKVIIKYHFLEAWLKTMIPANIINGFKVCGVYPFNPRAILDHDPCASKSKGAESNNGYDDSQPNATEDDMMQHINGGSDNNTENAIAESFTADEEILYNT